MKSRTIIPYEKVLIVKREIETALKFGEPKAVIMQMLEYKFELWKDVYTLLQIEL